MAHKRNPKQSKSLSKEYRNVKGSKRERLIAERKKMGLTQTQLAKKIGCSTSAISHLELGRVKPGIDISLGLESFFQQPFEVLFPDL